MQSTDIGTALVKSGQWVILYPEERQAEKAVHLGFSMTSDVGSYVLAFPISTWHRLEPVFRNGSMTLVFNGRAWCGLTGSEDLKALIAAAKEPDNHIGWHVQNAAAGLDGVRIQALRGNPRGDVRCLGMLLTHYHSPAHIQWVEITPEQEPWGLDLLRGSV